MSKRYTIRVQVVEVNDAGEVTDWIFQNTLEWATENRRLIFSECDEMMQLANEDAPANSTPIVKVTA